MAQINVDGYKILRDEEWVEVSVPEWEAFHGRRKMNIVFAFGEVEYHGPVLMNGKASSAPRVCRCDTCTLFEEDRRSRLSPIVLRAVEAMI